MWIEEVQKIIPNNLIQQFIKAEDNGVVLSSEDIETLANEFKYLAMELEADSEDTIHELKMRPYISVHGNLKIDVRFKGYDGKISRGYFRLTKGYTQGDLIDELTSNCVSIIDGSKKIRFINDLLIERRKLNRGVVNLELRWGASDKTSVCDICDWSYDYITVRINGNTLKNIVKLDESLIKDYIEKSKWGNDPVTVISEIPSLPIMDLIGVELDITNITKLLTDNMLSTSEAIALIKANKSEKGTQNIKTVASLAELGDFVAILNWSVDYHLKKVDVSIESDKVLDVENAQFVSNAVLYNRIERRMLPSIDLIGGI